MSDGITDAFREEERSKDINNHLDKLADHIFYYAKKYPQGELRESFVTDCMECICDKLSYRLKIMETR